MRLRIPFKDTSDQSCEGGEHMRHELSLVGSLVPSSCNSVIMHTKRRTLRNR